MSESVKHYTQAGVGYEINKNPHTEENKRHIDNISRHISKNRINKNTVLYRGIKSHPGKVVGPGGGFLSTSDNYGSAMAYAENHRFINNAPHSHLLKIHARKGDPVANIDHLSHYEGEGEHLIHKDASIHISHSTYDPEDEVYIHHGHIVHPTDIKESNEYKVGDKVSYGGKMYYVRKVKDGELWIRNASHTPVTKIHPDKVSAWQKKEKPAGASRGTCQICGGDYGTKMGNIAHHGYRRPGGWQTASCEGAKHLPYEKSRDVLGNHIEGLHRSHAFHSEKAEHHKKDHREPVDKIEHYKDVFGNKAQKVVTYHPDHPMYNRHKMDAQQHHANQTRIYANAIEHQTKRYNDWKKLDEVKRTVGRAAKLGSYLAKRWENRGSPAGRIDHSNYEDNDQLEKLLDAGAPTDHDTWKKISPIKIKMSDLTATQRDVKFDGDSFKTKVKDKSIRKPIHVVKHDGKHQILDGHHRVMGNKLLGNKYISARVYDLDKKEFGENVVRDDNRATKLLKYIEKRKDRKPNRKYDDPTIKYKDEKQDNDLASDVSYTAIGTRLAAQRTANKVKEIPIHKLTMGQDGTHWNAPDDVIKKKLNDSNPIGVIKHAGKLIKDHDWTVRAVVATHPRHAGHLVNDPDRRVKGAAQRSVASSNSLTESIMDYLLENRIEFLKKAHPHISTDHDSHAEHKDAHAIIDHLSTADPHPKKAYTQWILNQYKAKKTRQEDVGRIHTALSHFDKHKHRLEKRDINQYHHVSDVEDAVEPHIGEKSNKEIKRDIKHAGAELIHSGNGVTVHHIKTKEAACAYGAGTKWCTAAEKNNLFHMYGDDLHVIQHAGRKYQYHNPSGQFMDEKDRDVNVKDLHPHVVHELSKLPPHRQPEAIKLHNIKTSKEHAEKHISDPDPSIRAEVASHHPDLAGKLINDKNEGVRAEVARHPEHAGKLIKDHDWTVRAVVAKHKEHAEHLVNDPSPYVRAAVATHPEHVDKLIKDPEVVVRQIVARHPEHADKLIKDPKGEVRKIVAKHKEHAGRLVNDSDWTVRAEVARHPEHAGKLIKDHDWTVRAEVARHPEHAGKLINDPDRRVKGAAQRSVASSNSLTGSIMDYLLENRIEFLKKAHPHISTDHDPHAEHKDAHAVIDHLSTADPHPKKVYTQWILNQYKAKKTRQEDVGRIHTALSHFDKHKHRLDKRDINQYHHISDVEDAVEPHIGEKSNKEVKRDIKHAGAELIHSGNGVTVHHIKTKEAACAYGAGTRWCTAAEKNNMFNHYKDDLHVIHHAGRKYQYHNPSGQFMDEKDRDVDIGDLHSHIVHELSKLPPHRQPEAIKLHNIKSSKEQAEKYISDPEPHVRAAVAAHKEHAGKLVNDASMLVRHEVARHPEHAGKLVNDASMLVRHEVAKYKEHAGHLVNDPSPYVRAAVAAHKEHAGKLVNDPDHRVRKIVAKHKEHAGKLINDPKGEVRKIVAKHKEHAGHLVNDPSPYVRAAVATHKEHAGGLINDPDHHVRKIVAKHKEHAGKLIKDPEVVVRKIVAKHKEHAGHLVNDPYYKIRQVIAQHKEHAGHLVNDPSAYVRIIVAHHKEHAGHLVNDPSAYVRIIVAHHKEHAGKLIKDPEGMVRKMVATHLEHAGKLINDPDYHVRNTAKETLANNKPLTEAVTRDDERALRLLKYIEKRRVKYRGNRWTEPSLLYKEQDQEDILGRHGVRTRTVADKLKKETESGRTTEIPIHKLTMGQDGTDWKAEDHVIRKKLKDERPINVVKHPGEDKYNVWDGHHRVDAHRIMGKKTIKAYVADIEDSVGEVDSDNATRFRNALGEATIRNNERALKLLKYTNKRRDRYRPNGPSLKYRNDTIKASTEDETLSRVEEKKRTDDQILKFVKRLNKRSERTGIKDSGDGHDSGFAFSYKYKSWPEKKEPKDIYDYDLNSAMNAVKRTNKPKKVSLRGIVHTQSGVGFHAPDNVIKQKIKDDDPIEIVKHKGKKYLWDGHHRDFIARIRGEKSVRAHVVDTAKLEKWKV